jgi:GTP-binding protein
MDIVLEGFPPSPPEDEEPEDGRIRIAVIGRPNVGKSTLINRLIGEERLITSDVAGTTRDSILVPFDRDGRAFTLIDTAGVRRRARIDDEVEHLSVAKTLQAIAEAHVVTMVVDAHDSIGEQDASVLGLALNRGRALIIAVNKWDNIPPEQREEIKRLLMLKIDFVPFAPVHFISARHGTAVGDLTASMVRAYEAAMRKMPTPALTKCMERAMLQHQPPIVRGRRIRLRYAHQGGRNPPRIVVHGSQAAHVPESYKRYLANRFRDEFDLFATPVAVEFRSDVNPFLKDKPKEKRGLKTSQSERRDRRITKDRAKRAPKKKGGGSKQPGAPRGRSKRK